MSQQARPIITFTTDFGLQDHYVAAMKAAALRWCGDAQLIDITHLIPAQDIAAGAFVLERAVAAFGPGTVHVAVVDPGVGTGRRLLVVEAAGQHIICPDNGLISWVWHRHDAAARQLIWRPQRHSSTFHGRDILAPAAGMLAAGRFPVPAEQFIARSVVDPILLELFRRTDPRHGRIIHIDHYGNATTNLDPADGIVAVNDRAIGPIRRTYADVAPGAPLALLGSSELVEIAVRDGSARDALGLKVGDPVEIRPPAGATA